MRYGVDNANDHTCVAIGMPAGGFGHQFVPNKDIRRTTHFVDAIVMAVLFATDVYYVKPDRRKSERIALENFLWKGNIEDRLKQVIGP